MTPERLRELAAHFRGLGKIEDEAAAILSALADAQPVAWRVKHVDGHWVYGDESPLLADGKDVDDLLYILPKEGE